MTNYSQTYPKLTGLHNYCIPKKCIEIGGDMADDRAFFPCAVVGELFISYHLYYR